MFFNQYFFRVYNVLVNDIAFILIIEDNIKEQIHVVENVKFRRM